MHNLWLAYSFDRDVEGASDARVEAAIRRVVDHYASICAEPWVRRGWTDPSAGAVVFDVEDPPCRWPVWAEADQVGVATAYPPLGWRRVTGDVPASDAPIHCARALLADPRRIAELGPPFGMAVYDRARRSLSVINDGLGYAHLYEMRFKEGWVCSNQVGACALFAGTRPSADEFGWRTLATVGWCMGDTTPLQGVSHIPRGSVITVSVGSGRRRVESSDALQTWVSPRESQHATAEEVASDLTDTIRDACELWPETPEIDLSGGRDSRRVAAAAIAAGVDATFRTERKYDGEVTTAQELVRVAPRPMSHTIKEITDPTRNGDLKERATMLHLLYDGTYHPNGIGQSLRHPQRPRRAPKLSGGGAGIARAVYYSEKNLEDTEHRGEDGLFQRFIRHHAFGVGSGLEAGATTLDYAAEKFTEAERFGLQGITKLDYLYLTERLGRWQLDPVRLGSITTFVTPAFIRAGYDLAPRERVSDPFFQATVQALVPAWAEVPIFQAKDAKLNRPRIWEGEDAQVFEELVLPNEESWGGCFDPAAVRRLWEEAKRGEGLDRHQDTLERVVWRAFFEDHLARLDEAIAAERDPARP